MLCEYSGCLFVKELRAKFKHSVIIDKLQIVMQSILASCRLVDSSGCPYVMTGSFVEVSYTTFFIGRSS